MPAFLVIFGNNHLPTDLVAVLVFLLLIVDELVAVVLLNLQFLVIGRTVLSGGCGTQRQWVGEAAFGEIV